MLYLIGLGLNFDGISSYGIEIAKRCKRLYLESYTVDFPYAKGDLQELIGKKLIDADRSKVESLELVDEAKKMDVGLLIYGSPLMATTHITLIQEAKASGIKAKAIHAGSVFDAVAETGLQLYKFGKITSIPNFKADSFAKTIQENLSMHAHSLILVDIGMEFVDALESLENALKIHGIKLDKIVICQTLGTKNKKIMYKTLEEARGLTGVRRPYCIVIPSKLHFAEKEFLETFK
ncbi:MAG: diphthine synthase [Nanoarchaeota archaeon]|nr:diphthine synthase [Nanoarchaeota archaeon]